MIKKYLLYLTRWQLSTPILAICLIWFSEFGTTWSTIIANLIGGLIFFWVDKFIFSNKILRTIWDIKENVYCADCGKLCRGYRLVKTNKYDKSNENEPKFRCETCSTIKFNKLKEKGYI